MRRLGRAPCGGGLRLCSALLCVALSGMASLSSPAAVLGQTAGETELPVREFTLDNGFRVLMLPREGAPTVSFVMQFAVGGVHERLGTTGVAHLLEHMLFKGTETIGTRSIDEERRLFARMDSVHDEILAAKARGADGVRADLERTLAALEDEAGQYVESNAFDRILTRAGAQGLNAMTTNESTAYFVELPANRAELFFALEADRMAHPVFREFYSERDVVMEERRMRVDSSPGGALYEAFMRTAFAVHPYGVPVVGWMSDLETLRRADVERYYRDFYGPDNAVLALVGHFDPDTVEGWARQYLGSLARGHEPPPVLAVEPPQRGERRIEVEWDAEPLLMLGWHVPESMHDDAPALAILSSVLTGGRTSRLHRRLVTERRIATSIYSSMGPGSRFPQLFQIDAAPVSPTTPAELEEAIYEVIAEVAAEGPTDVEVERVRNQIAAGAVRRLDSNLGLAFQLADAESLFGDWRESFRAPERLDRVTPADVQRVAAKYLVRHNRTVGTLARPAGTK